MAFLFFCSLLLELLLLSLLRFLPFFDKDGDDIGRMVGGVTGELNGALVRLLPSVGALVRLFPAVGATVVSDPLLLFALEPFFDVLLSIVIYPEPDLLALSD